MQTPLAAYTLNPPPPPPGPVTTGPNGTPILDDFNRANSGPPVTPAPWHALGLGIGLKIAGNGIIAGTGDYDGVVYESAVNAPAESFFVVGDGPTVNTIDGNWQYLDLLTDAIGNNCYELELQGNSGGTFNAVDWNLYEKFSGTGINYGANLVSQPVNTGDLIAISYAGAGHPVIAWHAPAVGSWTQIVTYTPTHVYSSGYIGALDTGDQGLIDAFGGGSF